MKIAVFVLLVTLSSFCFAQSDKELKKQVLSIPRGTKQVILTVSDSHSSKEIVSGITAYLMDQGYEIDEVDRETGLIQTKDKNLKFAWSTRFTFLILGNKIRVRGKVIMELADNAARDIENKGSLGDAYVYSFRELVRITNQLPHESVEYLP
jgi:hypothetical protein